MPELLELQEIIGAAAGVAGGRGMAPQALAQLLMTAEPRHSIVLVIDDADLLPRQSLYYLAQILNVLAPDAPALQVVFAAGPALIERLSHSDFETFRNRITFADGVTEPSLPQQDGEPVFYPDTLRNKNLKQENDPKKGDPALGHGNSLPIGPRSVQLQDLPAAPRRLGGVPGNIARRAAAAYKAAVVLAISCLVTIGYVAFLVFSDDPTQSSAPVDKSNVQQEFAAASGRSPSAPLDRQESNKVIASLIDQATAAAAAGRFEEAGRLEQVARQMARLANGEPSQQVETALAQALPPSVSAAAAGQPETVGKTDQPILFPKLAAPAAPDAVPNQPVDVTQRAQMAMVPDGAAALVAADLPAFAPIRVVLIFARNNVARAERTAAIREALMGAEVEVANLVAVDAQRPRPSIGYYFRSDRDAAVGVCRRLEPLLGAVEPVLLQLRGRVPPGTIEIAVP
jgi:hypothetical protein